jgi:hypothetical protein
MPKSLLSRFQGALVGMSAGQKARAGKADPDHSLGNTFKNYVLLTGASIESIIHCRAVHLDDWLLTTNRLISEDQILIAILPVALYLHEDIPRLQATIQEIGVRHALDPESVASMLFLATGLAYLLTERCPPDQFVPQVLATISSASSTESLVYNQIQLIHEQVVINPVPTNITQMIGSIALAQQPYLLPMAMATYCFLCNPTSLPLATQRAAHIPQQSPLTLALTGLLVGAAQGVTVIPPSWFISAVSSQELLMPLAARLFATWAGVYPSEISLPDNYQAIAAPAVIQKRSSKKS